MKVASNGLVSSLIDFYTVWKDADNFYRNTNNPSCLVDDASGYPCFHHTDIESINQCQETIVVIDCLTEGLHSIDYFSQYRKDHHYIIFSNGTWDEKRWDLKINYTLIWFPFFLYDMVDTYNSPQRFCYYLDKEYIFDYPKPLSFISTIGNVRPQRDLLVKKITSQLDVNQFILRYSGQDLAVPSDRFDVITFNAGEFDPYTSILEKYYHSVSQSLPISLYNQSYFNLIVESDLDFDDSFFLTEKTVKSLIVGQPFVIFSTPSHLSNLRKIGFLTFNQLWDESYDNIKNLELRVDSILQLCKHLSTNFDWEANKTQLKNITTHNRFVFQNLNTFLNNRFRDIEKKLQGFY
jgi:hypothetical protein